MYLQLNSQQKHGVHRYVIENLKQINSDLEDIPLGLHRYNLVDEDVLNWFVASLLLAYVTHNHILRQSNLQAATYVNFNSSKVHKCLYELLQQQWYACYSTYTKEQLSDFPSLSVWRQFINIDDVCDKMTLLNLAVVNKHVAFVNALLKCGAKFDVQDSSINNQAYTAVIKDNCLSPRNRKLAMIFNVNSEGLMEQLNFLHLCESKLSSTPATIELSLPRPVNLNLYDFNNQPLFTHLISEKELEFYSANGMIVHPYDVQRCASRISTDLLQWYCERGYGSNLLKGLPTYRMPDHLIVQDLHRTYIEQVEDIVYQTFLCLPRALVQYIVRML